MNKDVPYIAFEAEQMRADRRDRRHMIIEIVLIVSLLASNAFWIFREHQYETVEQTDTVQQTVEADDGSDASAYMGEVDYIDEYIHNARDRSLLKDRLIDGMRFEPLAEKYDLSVRHTKSLVYKAEEKLFKHIRKD